MKKLCTFLTCILLTMSGILTSQNTLTVSHSTPDGMAAEITAALSGADAATIATLVIAGDAYVTFNDCRAIRAVFTTSSLTTLDLSQAKFENDSLPGIPEGQTPNNIGAFNATIPYTEGVSPTDANGLAVTEIILPAALRVVGDRVFRKFRQLTTITLPATVTHIGPGAFNACEQLRVINFPNGLKRIDDYAFYQCYRLGQHALNSMSELPEGLEGVIGQSAFRETSCFFEFIPEGITEIGTSAFRTGSAGAIIIPGTPTHPTVNQESLGLIFGQHITKIGGTAFQGQKYIDNIEIPRMTPPETGDNAFSGIGNGSYQVVDLYIPIGATEAFDIAPYNEMFVRAVLPPPTSVFTAKSHDFGIYPNPVTDFITISNDGQEAIQSVKILGLTGSVVENLTLNTSFTFDVSHLAKGMYILLLNESAAVKFVKN